MIRPAPVHILHLNTTRTAMKTNVLEDGDRRMVYEAGYFIDDDGQRATFRDGRFQNG